MLGIITTAIIINTVQVSLLPPMAATSMTTGSNNVWLLVTCVHGRNVFLGRLLPKLGSLADSTWANCLRATSAFRSILTSDSGNGQAGLDGNSCLLPGNWSLSQPAMHCVSKQESRHIVFTLKKDIFTQPQLQSVCAVFPCPGARL